MIISKLPLDENLRLEILRESRLLDTQQEAKFDFITEAASIISGCSISLISLVDSNRQWFKSKIGLDVAETSRDISFCSHVILQDGLF